jgi:hypothetical protein
VRPEDPRSEKGQMIRIFPAWSHLDREPMSKFRIAATNSSTPVDVCDEITLRQDWLNIALTNIRRSDCVVLVLTANSAKSVHCGREISYAHALGKAILIWAPGIAPMTPEWARDAIWLRDQPINAAQAVADVILILTRSLS